MPLMMLRKPLSRNVTSPPWNRTVWEPALSSKEPRQHRQSLQPNSLSSSLTHIRFDPELPMSIENAQTVVDNGKTNLVVHVILLSTAPVKVLTLRHEDDWYLPIFKYPAARPYTSSQCARDLQRSLCIESDDPYFEVIAELLPEKGTDFDFLYNPDGMARLTLLEAPPDFHRTHQLPVHARWSEVNAHLNILRSYLHEWHYSYVQDSAISFLELYADPSAASVDPRCTERWTHRAVGYLKSVLHGLQLTPISDVVRASWTSMSELFKVNTSKGWYYLKAPPPGCSEVTATKCIAELFPDETLHVVAADTSLNCFVAEGLRSIFTEKVLDEPLIVQTLAKIQLRSVAHLKLLKHAGVPDYSPAVLASMVDSWIMDPVVTDALENNEMSAEQLAGTLKTVCAALEASAVPRTLVHGDFVPRNVGVKDTDTGDETVILYDWELAYISHPFCDFFRKDYSVWSEKARLDYLSSWSDFQSLEEAKHELELGVTVGWVATITSLISRRTVPSAQRRTFLERSISSYIKGLISHVKKKHFPRR